MPGRAFGSWYWYQLARRRENPVKTVARRTFWYPYTVWPLKFKKGKVTGWAVKASSQQLCHASDRRQRPGVDITLSTRAPSAKQGCCPFTLRSNYTSATPRPCLQDPPGFLLPLFHRPCPHSWDVVRAISTPASLLLARLKKIGWHGRGAVGNFDKR